MFVHSFTCLHSGNGWNFEPGSASAALLGSGNVATVATPGKFSVFLGFQVVTVLKIELEVLNATEVSIPMSLNRLCIYQFYFSKLRQCQTGRNYNEKLEKCLTYNKIAKHTEWAILIENYTRA